MLAKIPVEWVFSRLNKYAVKSKNITPNRVRCLSFPATGTLYKKNSLKTRYSMPKSWFTNRAEYLFEGRLLYSSKEYDEVLKYIYGKYMELPPKDKREQHSPFSKIKFQDEEMIV